MRKNFVLVGVFSILVALNSSPVLADFVIDATYDAAWQAENNSVNGALDAAVQSAINTYENLFTNNVTININFQWGGAGTNNGTGAAASPTYALAGNYGNGNGLSLAATKTLFSNHATAHPENTAINTAVGFLPANLSSLNAGTLTTFNVGNPEYEALLSTISGPQQNSNATDGIVGFGTGSSSANWAAFALHEISHVMGRVDYAFATTQRPQQGGLPPALTPLDFFKYTTGTTTLNPAFSQTSFSINGGTTDILGGTFSSVSDSSDWNGSNVNDPYNAFSNGTATLTPVDITVMNALGWDPRPVPEPSTFALAGLGGIGLVIGAYRRRRANVV